MIIEKKSSFSFGMMETQKTIISKIPHKKPFLFVDNITSVTDTKIEGDYYLDKDLNFYRGHYPNHPITPGVILIEIMAQIGLVAFGIYLVERDNKHGISVNLNHKIPVLSTTDIKFKKVVEPDQRVFVISEKKLFKHNKLICKAKLLNIANEVLAEGTISGFILDKNE